MDTSTPDLESLAVRVEKLERQNRLLRKAGLALLLLPACLAIMGQARPSRTLEAQNFILRDSAGMKRAELAVLDAGPILRFFDSKEQVRAFISGTGYTIFGTGTRTFGRGQESVRVPITRLGLDPSGLHVDDERGGTVIQLGGTQNLTTGSPTPSLILFGTDGKVLWSAP